ncbi:hypothetical protein FACS1894104_3910 [Actinomycetota bacterium]|nr:hypothetical protein FACS1894104_3910 [Actinomycetota bacterium]
MAEVIVFFRGDIINAVGTKQVIMQANTVRDLMRQIKSQYGKETYKNAKRMLIAVNGLAAIKQKGYSTPLNDGDIVKLFPICGGG